MKLKGVMKIDLTNKTTGEVQSVTEENIITEAVNDIFALNPFAVHFTAGHSYEGIEWYKDMLPICPNLIGGILLFSKPLKEDAAAIYPTGDNLPVAYASNDVNSSANLQRGSLNLSESKVLDNGYRFVWEFSPSQGNGTITAAALTSRWGGANAFGSTVETATTFKEMKMVDDGSVSETMIEYLFFAVEFDFEKELLYSITYKDDSVVVTKLRVPVTTLGLNEQLNDTTITVLDEQALSCQTFKWADDDGNVTGDFFDGQDGYWYGFATPGNSDGDAVLYWIKIKKEDFSFTEGSWTFEKVAFSTIGDRDTGTLGTRRKLYAVMRQGYLYVMGNAKDCIYKINANNQTDITKIELGFTSEFSTMGASSQSLACMICVNDIIMGWDFYMGLDDKPVQITGTKRFENPGSPFFQYKTYLVQWGADYSTPDRYVYLLSPYLASVNNLSQMLTKTAEQTMKITYEVTEEKEDEAAGDGTETTGTETT